MPPRPETAGASANVHLRYEDISQDGRLLLEVMPNALGAAVWGAQLSRDPLAQACLRAGVVPVLTRFVIEGTPGPFGLASPLSVTGRFTLAQVENEKGELERVVLNMWADLTGPIARTYPPAPEHAGDVVSAGRIFGEHVFTRLFAPPGQRRVARLDLPGAPPELPRYHQPSFASMLDLRRVHALEELSPDDTPVVFGLVHTDSNQHVNSLVYLRLFEEAALRRFAKLGRTQHVLARKLEIAYRKPCFAGDRMRIHVAAVEHEGKLGALAAIMPDQPERGDALGAHAIARLGFES